MKINRIEQFMKKIIVGLIIISANLGLVSAERIKDITDIHGIRGNQLMGMGLVIGLSDTGDSSTASRQIMTNIFRQSGVVLDPVDLKGQNIAVVMVTANLGPFDRQGSRIDIDVASVGDAESLQGGMLMATPLKGLDGQVYAVAQGGISLGGWGVSGKNATVKKNHLTVGRIAAGAIVERDELATFVEQIADKRVVTFNLRNEDFTTARNISGAINKLYPECASVIDAGAVRAVIPENVTQKDVIAFIDNINMQEVKVDMPAIVVINERTGTIVVGEKVAISAVAISQGGLVVKIKETEQVSQPNGYFSDAGSTEKVEDTIIDIEDRGGFLVPVPKVVTVSELAKALNAIGATPTDMVAIFNALKMAGALQAKLEIM